MRILHTADWHLGVSPDQAPRSGDHARFLDWLSSELRDRSVDVLLIAGDLFHQPTPSASALALYYEFFARARAVYGLRRVVVVAGNHDSASRLGAPAEVLRALRVEVVGAVARDPERWSDLLVPIRGADGEVELVVAAVPYVHESQLGAGGEGASIASAFRALYDRLAREAKSAHPGAALVAMGHLTCAAPGEAAGPFHTPLHRFETSGVLPPSIFCDDYDYVALGHIHAMRRLGDSAAWYAGSPVPTDATEALSPRYVLQIDLEPDRPASVLPIKVPGWRRTIALDGPLEAILARIEQDFKEVEELEPYLYIDVRVKEHDAGLIERVRRALESVPEPSRPRIVRLRELLDAPATPREPHAGVALADLDPREVFVRLWTSTHNSAPSRAILDAFDELLRETPSDR